MGTIYMGIMLNLQNTILRMPDVMVRQMLSKEAEGVSDYGPQNCCEKFRATRIAGFGRNDFEADGSV